MCLNRVIGRTCMRELFFTAGLNIAKNHKKSEFFGHVYKLLYRRDGGGGGGISLQVSII